MNAELRVVEIERHLVARTLETTRKDAQDWLVT